MAKSFYPTPELRAALAALLGLENLNNVRSIKINMDNSGDPITVDVAMFVWDHDRLASVVQQLTIDDERVTNVSIGITPVMAEHLERQRQADQS
jgi:hypothetical protein